MSWRRLSLFTNMTRVPGATVSSFGLTPADVIVKVFGFVGLGLGVGVGPPPPPPQVMSTIDPHTASIRFTDQV